MGSNKYTKDDCINALIEAKEQLGHAPSQTEYKDLDISPSYQTIAQKFGRWNLAKEKLDMDTNRPSHLEYQDGCPDILTYTEEEWNNLSKNMRFRNRNRAKVANIKLDLGCDKCGYSDNPAALEFHHTDPSNKEFGISRMISQGYAWERVMNEISKCIVLCANCHNIHENDTVYDL